MHMPEQEDFPLPFEYIDIFRTTLTDLDNYQEKQIDDFWTSGTTVEMEATLSNYWKGSTRFQVMRPQPKRNHR